MAWVIIGRGRKGKGGGTGGGGGKLIRLEMLQELTANTVVFSEFHITSIAYEYTKSLVVSQRVFL